jgi:hypothetical protein
MLGLFDCADFARLVVMISKNREQENAQLKTLISAAAENTDADAEHDRNREVAGRQHRRFAQCRRVGAPALNR